MSDAISLTKDVKKPHRASTSGAKANKKKDKAGKVSESLFGSANFFYYYY